MTRRRFMLALLALQFSLCLYCMWQLMWTSAAWGLVTREGESIVNMASSIDSRIARVLGGLVALGVTVVVGVAALVVRAQRPRA